MRDEVNDPHNVRERVARAVEALATGAQSIQDRVSSAGHELAQLQAKEFTDPDGRRLYEEIWAGVTRIDGDGEEGSISATTTRFSDEEAVDVARKIVSLDSVYRLL